MHGTEDEGIAVDVFLSVLAVKPTKPLDFDTRVKAVNHFRTLAEAESLAAANKRVVQHPEQAGWCGCR